MDIQTDLQKFCQEARNMGASNAVVVSPQKVFTANWVRIRCQFGCSEYGQCLTCPPYSPEPETTRKILDEYQLAILLHSENYKSLKRIARKLEDVVFLSGYYKAFSFPCGPCGLCKECVVMKLKRGKPALCKHPEMARPSMEASGIDVYATAHAAGLPIKVVRTDEDPQNYYSLVLVE